MAAKKTAAKDHASFKPVAYVTMRNKTSNVWHPGCLTAARRAGHVRMIEKALARWPNGRRCSWCQCATSTTRKK